ncbi:hypothetical protein [Jiella pelagia]|uniref:Uncharacterized protein n=1 Tax=Jiella pelagia TaxID=2986949 RepID=A0ABY7BXK5_9HYPH|nr:hypothetical protein [Jiella pelagia]WAP67845.1 hypothetical protein OH818_20670 [Jiella pelagia]
MKLIVCFPLLDLRYFLVAQDTPGRPGWTVEQFRTIGSLGKVLCTVREDPTGAAADVSPALLFKPEFSKTLRKGRSRSLACPKLDSGVEILGRRLSADTHGHVRLEILFDSADAEFDGAFDMLETLLDETVEVPREDFEPLALAGKLFARLYLEQSAKTAPPWPESLPDRLLREGLGSPFAIVVMDAEAMGDEGTALAGGSSLFPEVHHGSVNLYGTDVTGWILRHSAGPPPGWMDHARALCRILCALREVRLLAALDAAETADPFHLDREEVTRALRRNERFVRKKMFGGWPVREVLALEDRIAHAAGVPVMPADPALRRDAARSVERSLSDVRKASEALPEIPRLEGSRMIIAHEDIERLVLVLRDEAINSGDPRDYFAAKVRAAEPREPDSRRGARPARRSRRRHCAQAGALVG